MGNPLTDTGFHRAIEPLKKNMDSTKLLLQGPDGKPQEGMIVRMDRVERIIRQLVFFACGMAGVGFAVLSALIIFWITK